MVNLLTILILNPLVLKCPQKKYYWANCLPILHTDCNITYRLYLNAVTFGCREEFF